MKHKELLLFFLGVLSSLVVEAISLYKTKVDGLAVRLVSIDILKDKHPEAERTYGPCEKGDNKKAFLNLLKKNGFTPDSEKSVEQVLRLQKWVGDHIHNVGVFFGAITPYELLQEGLKGTPLACDSMSRILREALALLGYKARNVQLYADIFNSDDTHVVVEVFIGDRWLIFDPTFNVTYQTQEKKLLGVREVQTDLKQKGPESVKAIYHGARVYPARLETYYMDWRPLFTNAAYISTEGTTKFPPLRWWLGPKYYYFGESPTSLVKSHNSALFISIVVVPTLLIIVFAILCMLLISGLRKKKCAE